MAEHDLDGAFTAAEACIDREEDKHVGKTYHVVNDQRFSIASDQLRTIGCSQVGKEAEESDRCIIDDQFYDIHDAIGEISKGLCSHRFRSA